MAGSEYEIELFGKKLIYSEGKLRDIDAICDLCKGVEIDKEILMPPTLITAENVDEYFPD